MNIAKHFKDGTMLNELAAASQIRAARAILMAVEGLRDEYRAMNETRPQRNNEDLTKDWVYLAGMVRAFNIVLSLPDDARKYIDKLPEYGEPK